MTSQETAEMKHVINGSNIQFLVDAPEQRWERDEAWTSEYRKYSNKKTLLHHWYC